MPDWTLLERIDRPHKGPRLARLPTLNMIFIFVFLYNNKKVFRFNIFQPPSSSISYNHLAGREMIMEIFCGINFRNVFFA